MRRGKRALALFVISVAFTAITVRLNADDVNRAAVVVAFGDGSVAARCVAFEEPQITGLEALERSDLALELDYQGAGAAVCRIDETGCQANDCFCACTGGDDCVYWSYWHRSGAEWQYSLVGASTYPLSDGAMDGWAWGPGSVERAVPPPDLSFEEVCPGEEAVTTAAPPAATTAQIAASSTLSATTDEAAPVATLASVEQPQVGQDAGPALAGWLPYVALVGILLVLGGVVVYARRRRSGDAMNE